MTVRILLDTSVFLWLLTEPERVGAQLDVVVDPANQLFVSAASSWEIAIKVGTGKLPLPFDVERYVPQRIRAIGADPLALEHAHVLAVARLPMVHRDPFDRVLVAQAKLLGLTLLTSDPVIARYDVDAVLV